MQAKRVEYGGINFEMLAGHKEIQGMVPEYVYRDRPVIVLSCLHTALTYAEVIDLLEKIVDLRYVGYWILREAYLHRPRSLVVGLSSTIIPRIPDTPMVRKLLDVSKKGWKSERPRLLFRQGPPAMEDVNSPSVISGMTSGFSLPTMPTPRPMMPRTYSAAVATPTEQHMIDRNDMISAVQQHMSQLEQRMQVKIREQIQQHAQQQEQRLAHTERTAKQLADTTSTLVDRVDELAKKSADTDAKLDRIMEQEERIVGRLTTEIRGSISSMLGGNRNE